MRPPCLQSVAAGEKRKRRSALQKTIDDLNEAEVKVETLNNDLSILMGGVSKRRLSKSIHEKVEKLEYVINIADGVVMCLRKKKEELEEKEKVKQASEAAKAEKQALQGEITKHMSVDEKKVLVTIHLEAQSKFDNKVDKNDNVWQHLADKYNHKVVTMGISTLQEEESRSVDSLKARFSSSSQRSKAASGSTLPPSRATTE